MDKVETHTNQWQDLIHQQMNTVQTRYDIPYTVYPLLERDTRDRLVSSTIPFFGVANPPRPWPENFVPRGNSDIGRILNLTDFLDRKNYYLQ